MGLGTGVAVFNSQVVPIPQVVAKTGFTYAFCFPGAIENYYTHIVLLGISMTFQTILLLLSLVLLLKDSKKKQTNSHVVQDPSPNPGSFGSLSEINVVRPNMDKDEIKRHMIRINDTLAIVSMLLAFLHIIRSAISAALIPVVPPSGVANNQTAP